MQGLRVDPKYLSDLQYETTHIRNICIVAHIDHGKTTLADSLVCSNGIISPKMAGKLRFLDSTEDEQKRGITMHSSAISLLYQMESLKTVIEKMDPETESEKEKEKESQEASKPEDYLINLVDSPGHIDFSSDVSTATRLCDGALIVVDVLEGVCSQTHALLYKALRDRLNPCLVLNKVDRLITELKLTPLEAFQHLRRVLERVNAVASTLLLSEIRFKDEKLSSSSTTNDSTSQQQEEDDNPLVQIWNFEPEKGNVIFCSAFDCWGFSINRFSFYWAKKLSINKNILQKHLFDDYGFNPNTKKILKIDTNNPQMKPMFVTMILEPIWQMYDVIFNQQNTEKAAKMAKRALGVEVPSRDIAKAGGDPRNTLRAIMGRWIPLADAVLRMIVRWVPNPIEAQTKKLRSLFATPQHERNEETGSEDNSDQKKTQINLKIAAIQDSVSHCAYRSTPLTSSTESKSEVEVEVEVSEPEICIFIAKMIPVRISELNPIDTAHALARLSAQGHDVENAQFDQEVFLALGRVFSGSLVSHSNRPLYLLGYHHDPYADLSIDQENLEIKTYKEILDSSHIGTYMCLGPSIQSVDCVPAGNIVAIYGLDEFILKSGTLSSSLFCYPMTAITFQAKPMLQVAIEPTHHANLKQIEIGLQKIYQYDPVVEVGVDESGQNTLTCLGELHLELCLKALKERFAKCDFIVSEPLVSFRESIIYIDQPSNYSISNRLQTLPPPWKDMNGLQNVTTQGQARLVMGNNRLAITLRCFPLPKKLLTQIDLEKSDRLSILKKYLEKRDTFQLHQLNEINWNEFPIDERFYQFWEDIIQSIIPSDDINDLANRIDSSLQFSSSLSTNHGEFRGFDLFSRILSLGPNGCGSNLLLLSPDCHIDVLRDLVQPMTTTENEIVSPEIISTLNRSQSDSNFHQIFTRLKSALITGFQFASSNGPLMAEPLYGVGITIEKIEISQQSSGSNFEMMTSANDSTTSPDNSVNTTTTTTTAIAATATTTYISIGQLISDVKDTIKICLLSSNIRLVEPIYKCSIQCDQSQLGNLYSVLSKRRGDVVDEDIIEGTTFFILTVVLPVIESFGFSQELLKKTSGSATSPQLFFSHWEIMNEDPFWKPTTAEELEDLGEVVHEMNLPRQRIDAIRRRKGLVVEEKIVIHAEKQRTLTRNK